MIEYQASIIFIKIIVFEIIVIFLINILEL